MNKTVIELFAGVGGFRVGLNSVKLSKAGKAIEKNNFQFVWANQWEPSTKAQDAFLCYEARFGESSSHVNENISKINKSTIPNHTLLVGGFPCQDYSVARTIANEKGIEGKKGVLWWQINDVLKIKRPPFILLENVDRLLRSPSTKRGRDFGVMLRCLDDLGYGVEWRVINAADYGFGQRRRRVFIFGFHKSTNYYNEISKLSGNEVIFNQGIFAKTFPVHYETLKIEEENLKKSIYKDLVSVSDEFSFHFENSGLLLKGLIKTVKTQPDCHAAPVTLRQLLEVSVDSKYFIKDESKYKVLKEHKKKERTSKSGHKYYYSEGRMTYPDKLDLPARTMLTSESSVNRSTHVVADLKTNRNRLLTPLEAERINGFPDNWTNTGMTDKRRYFMMGNALVVGVVEKLGLSISELINKE